MADDRRADRDEHDPDSAETNTDGSDVSRETPAWSNVWQVPAILGSIVVILLGLYVAMQRAPANDFDAAFDQIDQMIAGRDFELAALRLNEVIEPNLDDATALQQARFEATVADWISLSQEAAGLDLETNNRRIADRYRQAVDYGAMLDPARIERWADALLALGDFEAARRRLAELDDLAAERAGLEIRRRQNHVLRRIVETSLRQPDLSFDALMEMLEGYRADPLLAPEDELWAIARQAELRLEVGTPQACIDHLLIDMRRFEPKIADTPQINMGELYALLGRAYYDLGNFTHAKYHADTAIEQIASTHPARAGALVLQGRIAVYEGRWHDAFEQFDRVVRNHGSSSSAAAGRLGRAEVHSILGDAKRSLSDYEALRELLQGPEPHRDIGPEQLGVSLAHRHDAALTMGRLDTALDYILLSETFFPTGQIPADILYRIASTSRQLADDTMTAARGGRDAGAEAIEIEDVDPALRYEANTHYRRAGDHYVRHARTLTGRAGEDENWAESLWLAAESYDLGGWHDLAVTHLTEYIAGRSSADPRRIDAVYRLAQAHHANLDYEPAARFYQEVITEHPRSHMASRSYVPLARCLLALDRRPEAQQQLLQVLTGRRHLKPDAVHYRDALIELGMLYYDGGEYARAIEQLDEAARRYGDDERIDEIRFRLADSHRRRAGLIEGELSDPIVTPEQRRRLETQRGDHLRTAGALFAAVSDSDGSPVTNRRSKQLRRYASMYRADCAFELEMYPRAVELYDEFARRFADHHSSMTALIQIVNCYSNLSDDNRARTAHRRAIVRLRELPDDAFDEPDALLDRRAWERWLKNMPAGQTRTASAAGS